ncbi:hypothetical protein [Plantactinospora sp. GCM10030261]|uniref:hypothetical protein n=1 Tax=Plantactinospora sp. GCM10030261 TaxID=3273420 RepID=UPI00360E6950
MSDADLPAGYDRVQWTPANHVERMLALAVAREDIELYAEILVNNPLYLPGFTEPGRLLYTDHEGVRHLVVFTSVEELNRGAGEAVDGWRGTTLNELRQAWPDPAWGLAVNPSALIGVYLSAEQVWALSLPDEPPVSPRDDTERLMYDGLLAEDLAAVLHSLVTARVEVAVRGATAGADLQWMVEDLDGVATVTVFTGGRHPGPSVLTEDLVTVLRRWPPEADQLAVNPRTQLSLRFSRERIEGLLRAAGSVRDPGPPIGPTSDVSPPAAAAPNPARPDRPDDRPWAPVSDGPEPSTPEIGAISDILRGDRRG